MILTVSWRNIWRNKLRSAVVITAMALGIFAGVFSWGFYRGMVVQRISTAITTESSHIQVHHRNYMDNPDQKFFIGGIDSIAAIVDTLEGVKAVSRRILVNALISSAETGSGVKVVGIQPEQERQVTNIHSKIREGSYFGSIRKTPIIIGEKLAGKLSVKLRSRVVITLQNMDGTLTPALFRVEAIYKTSSSVFDETNVFVRGQTISGLMNMEDHSGHELAVLLRDNEQLDHIAGMIRRRFPDLDTRTWKEIMPEVSIVEESMDISLYVFMGFVLLALIFAIINTMLMAVLERIKELGMLMAVGMNKTRIFIMIMLETVFLSLTGGAIGILAGYAATVFFGHKGIDLSRFAEGIEKLGYESTVYPVPDFMITLKVALMVLLTGMVAALYPAWKAIQLKPAEALRIDI